jgi:hypothetical protein
VLEVEISSNIELSIAFSRTLSLNFERLPSVFISIGSHPLTTSRLCPPPLLQSTTQTADIPSYSTLVSPLPGSSAP